MLLSLDVQVVEDAAGAAKGTHDIRGECLKLLCRTPGILALLFAAFYGLLVVDIRTVPVDEGHNVVLHQHLRSCRDSVHQTESGEEK